MGKLKNRLKISTIITIQPEGCTVTESALCRILSFPVSAEKDKKQYN